MEPVSYTHLKSLFLEELFKDNSGYIDIREFNKTGGVTGRHFMTLPQAQAQQWPGDKNIWFGVYARGDKRNGKAAGCTSTAALWLDFDNMNLQEVRARLEVAGLPPGSIYVDVYKRQIMDMSCMWQTEGN